MIFNETFRKTSLRSHMNAILSMTWVIELIKVFPLLFTARFSTVFIKALVIFHICTELYSEHSNSCGTCFFTNDIDFNLYFSFCEMLRYKTLFIVGLYLGPIYHYLLHFRRWTYVKNILNQNNVIIASTLGILLKNITIICLCIVLFNGRAKNHKQETHTRV